MRSPASIRPKSAMALPMPWRNFLNSRSSLNSAEGLFFSVSITASDSFKKTPHHWGKCFMFQQKGVVTVCRGNQVVFGVVTKFLETGDHLFGLIGGIEPVGAERVELERRPDLAEGFRHRLISPGDIVEIQRLGQIQK